MISFSVVSLQPSYSAELDSRDSKSPFGVLEFLPWDHEWNGHHYSPEKVEKAVALMKEAGIGWIRMDFLWDDVEPSEDQWKFEKYDRIVELLSKNEIKILGLLNYNATWSGQDWNSPPNLNRFKNYVQKTVERYKSLIQYWEVWNEPNHEVYWKPQDGMKAYTELLKVTYTTVKEVDPSAIVVLGGLASPADRALTQIYTLGGREYFDLVDFHPFQNPASPQALEKVKNEYGAVYQVMKENGDQGKSVWLTELGCPGVPDLKEVREWWLGPNPDEKTQGQWVQSIYGEPLRWAGVQKVFWAFFRDTPNHFGDGTDYFGLVREDFSKKPAYEAYQKMTRGGDLLSKDI